VNEETLLARAREAGIQVDWVDAMGRPQRVRTEALRRLLDSLNGAALPAGPPPLVTARLGRRILLSGIEGDVAGELALEGGKVRPVTLRDGAMPGIAQPGYHRLRFADREVTLAVAPTRCVTLQDIGQGRRMWGVAAQVYSLRRAGDGGIGDAGAVRDLAVAAARHGADAVALSPVHSLFPHEPGRAGPYSPSNRLFLNPLYADPADTFDTHRVAEEASDEPASLIDWADAGAAKLARFRRLFDSFVEVDTPLVRDFEAFIRAGGEPLAQHARYEAQFAGPERYHLFLQWITARSFAAAQHAAREAGMRIGLVSDLAIGMDRGGSHAWARQSDLLMDLSVGAPPDAFNIHGQDWGLTGFSPRALVATGFEPFLATLSAALAHAGGVRIDHIMGLMRLWLIPRGLPADEGAYVTYPLEDLLGLLALESHRRRAVVIGEDLGTVPPGLRARLRRAGIAGMDVLWFERTRQSFKKPARWRDDAVAMTSTHDLPTVAGWWTGEDMRLRRSFGLSAPDEQQVRERDRVRLWRAFTESGVADSEMPPLDQPAPVVDAAIGHVAQSPAPLMLAPLEDLLGLVEQPNLPGTIDEHPNWRRRLQPRAAQLFEQRQVRNRVELIAKQRGVGR
jgi:4-alpha-glucanotransferase